MTDASQLLPTLLAYFEGRRTIQGENGAMGIGQLLETNALVAELTRTFRPLECSAEVYDFEKQLRYRVFAPSGSALISISGIPLSKLFERDALDAEIDKTRARLEQQGFVLEARPS